MVFHPKAGVLAVFTYAVYMDVWNVKGNVNEGGKSPNFQWSLELEAYMSVYCLAESKVNSVCMLCLLAMLFMCSSAKTGFVLTYSNKTIKICTSLR